MDSCQTQKERMLFDALRSSSTFRGRRERERKLQREKGTINYKDNREEVDTEAHSRPKSVECPATNGTSCKEGKEGFKG